MNLLLLQENWKMAAARYILLGIIVCLLSSPGHLLNAERHTMWFHDRSYDNLLPLYPTMTSSFVTTSEFQCARSCKDDVTCNSFFYNDVSKTCAPQWLVFVSPWNTTEGHNWRYYRFSTASCPRGASYVIDRVSMTCYRPVTSPKLTWTAARDTCRDNGEELTVLEPVAKAHFVTSFLYANNDTEQQLYIGGSRPHSTWNTTNADFVWLTGQQVDITALQAYKNPAFPASNDRKNVLVVSPAKQTFHNAGDAWERAYICERPLSV
ncbi:uncharacterized protein [Littorina saxatilis]|uniref:uncharacterized protein n=1 Tax=Littorina saxatilis TaxID=31220 RepID=UPI0038B4A9DF